MYVLVFFLFLIVPAVLGVAEVLHCLKIAMLSSKENSFEFNCIFLEEENAVIHLKAFCEERNWNGIKNGKEYFAIYNELSQEVLNECDLIAEKNDIEFLNSKEFFEKIKDY